MLFNSYDIVMTSRQRCSAPLSFGGCRHELHQEIDWRTRTALTERFARMEDQQPAVVVTVFSGQVVEE
jgi:hypothetical protein